MPPKKNKKTNLNQRPLIRDVRGINRITNTELMFDFPSSKTDEPLVREWFGFNAFMTGWIASQALGYQRYRFTALEASFLPASTANSPGLAVIAFIADPLDVQPKTLSGYIQMNSSSVQRIDTGHAIHGPAKLKYDFRHTGRDWHVVRHKEGGSQASLHMYPYGYCSYATHNHIASPGFLVLKYTIEFSEPCGFSSNISQRMLWFAQADDDQHTPVQNTNRPSGDGGRQPPVKLTATGPREPGGEASSYAGSVRHWSPGLADATTMRANVMASEVHWGRGGPSRSPGNSGTVDE